MLIHTLSHIHINTQSHAHIDMHICICSCIHGHTHRLSHVSRETLLFGRSQLPDLPLYSSSSVFYWPQAQFSLLEWDKVVGVPLTRFSREQWLCFMLSSASWQLAGHDKGKQVSGGRPSGRKGTEL